MYNCYEINHFLTLFLCLVSFGTSSYTYNGTKSASFPRFVMAMCVYVPEEGFLTPYNPNPQSHRTAATYTPISFVGLQEELRNYHFLNLSAVSVCAYGFRTLERLEHALAISKVYSKNFQWISQETLPALCPYRFNNQFSYLFEYLKRKLVLIDKT